MKLKNIFRCICLFGFLSIGTSYAAEPIEQIEITSIEKDVSDFFTVNKVNRAAYHRGSSIDYKKVFYGSPLIYIILFLISLAAVAIWFYISMHLKKAKWITDDFDQKIHSLLAQKNSKEAMLLCKRDPSLYASVVHVLLQSGVSDAAFTQNQIKAEGKRLSVPYFQKMSLLNDFAVISPMIGLLGTVFGLFYAFYGLERSQESITKLFDGLGVAVGTTLAGLIVAVLSMIFASTLKYKLIQHLSIIEARAQSLFNVMKSTPNDS